jgi:hypothetical protein
LAGNWNSTEIRVEIVIVLGAINPIDAGWGKYNTAIGSLPYLTTIAINWLLHGRFCVRGIIFSAKGRIISAKEVLYSEAEGEKNGGYQHRKDVPEGTHRS